MSLKNLVSSLWNNSENKAHEEAVKSAALGIGIGMAAGALLALLFAPMRGAEVRKNIADTAVRAARKVRNAVEEARERLDIGQGPESADYPDDVKIAKLSASGKKS